MENKPLYSTLKADFHEAKSSANSLEKSTAHAHFCFAKRGEIFRLEKVGIISTFS